MDSLNTLQRILNSIEASLSSGGPPFYADAHGLCGVVYPASPSAGCCYGMLWNGRVLQRRSAC